MRSCTGHPSDASTPIHKALHHPLNLCQKHALATPGTMADHDDDEKKGGPAYKVSDKVSMDKILAQDEADESLRKYKASLGLTTNVYSRKSF